MATPPTAVFFVIICSAAAIASSQRDSPPPPPATDPYARFNPSILIIVVILFSAFFLMAFFAIYIRRCSGDDPSTVRAGGARSRRATAAALRGLDPAVVAAFPTLEYSVVKDLKLGKSTLECAVCLCEFDDDEALRLLPACSHVFHPDCIGEWLRSHTTCPVCRANLAAAGQTPTPPDPIPAADSGSDPDSVAIDVDADPISAANLPARLPAAQRAKSMRRAMFPRSLSTGHSVVRRGEDCERYTLRLPEEVRKELLRGKLNRTGSSVGGRGRSFGKWERFARSDRWVPFFSQSFSGRPSSLSIRRGREEPGGGGDGGSVGRSGRMLLTSVKAPFECLTGARAGAGPDPGESSSRSAVPVFTVTSSG